MEFRNNALLTDSFRSTDLFSGSVSASVSHDTTLDETVAPDFTASSLGPTLPPSSSSFRSPVAKKPTLFRRPFDLVENSSFLLNGSAILDVTIPPCADITDENTHSRESSPEIVVISQPDTVGGQENCPETSSESQTSNELDQALLLLTPPPAARMADENREDRRNSPAIAVISQMDLFNDRENFPGAPQVAETLNELDKTPRLPGTPEALKSSDVIDLTTPKKLSPARSPLLPTQQPAAVLPASKPIRHRTLDSWLVWYKEPPEPKSANAEDYAFWQNISPDRKGSRSRIVLPSRPKVVLPSSMDSSSVERSEIILPSRSKMGGLSEMGNGSRKKAAKASISTLVRDFLEKSPKASQGSAILLSSESEGPVSHSSSLGNFLEKSPKISQDSAVVLSPTSEGPVSLNSSRDFLEKSPVSVQDSLTVSSSESKGPFEISNKPDILTENICENVTVESSKNLPEESEKSQNYLVPLTHKSPPETPECQSNEVHQSVLHESPVLPICSPLSELRAKALKQVTLTSALSQSTTVEYHRPKESQHSRSLRRALASPSFCRRDDKFVRNELDSRFNDDGKVRRKKEERKLLHGFDCKCCAGYYDALGLNTQERLERIDQVSCSVRVCLRLQFQDETQFDCIPGFK